MVVTNKSIVDIVMIGIVFLKFSSGKTLNLKNVFHMSSISECLVSLRKLDENGIRVALEAGNIVFHKRQHFIRKASDQLGIYPLNLDEDGSNSGASTIESVASNVSTLFEDSIGFFVSAIDVIPVSVNKVLSILHVLFL